MLLSILIPLLTLLLPSAKVLVAIVAIIVLSCAAIKAKAQNSTTGGTPIPIWGIQCGPGDGIKVDSTVIATKRYVDSIANAAKKTDTIFTPVINTAFRFSTVRDYIVRIAVSISVTSVLVGTNSGTIALQKSADGSTNWITVNSSALVISGVVSTQASTQLIVGFLPAGWYYRWTGTSAGVNTATFTPQVSNANSL